MNLRDGTISSIHTLIGLEFLAATTIFGLLTMFDG